MIKAVLVDRDGTINVDKGYVYKSEDFVFLPGVIESFKLLVQYGIKIYIITNQAGIAKGYYTEGQFKKLTQYILNLFQEEGINIEETLYCPHHPEGIIPEYTKTCGCRKPNTELIESVMKGNNYEINDLALIGDRESDIDAGHKMGIRTYLVLTGYGLEHERTTKATHVKPNLLEAVQHLLSVNAA
jgi:D-glycero-D-manno-heptose 1,7-bisphosphate phosphatase